MTILQLNRSAEDINKTLNIVDEINKNYLKKEDVKQSMFVSEFTIREILNLENSGDITISQNFVKAVSDKQIVIIPLDSTDETGYVIADNVKYTKETNTIGFQFFLGLDLYVITASGEDQPIITKSGIKIQKPAEATYKTEFTYSDLIKLLDGDIQEIVVSENLLSNISSGVQICIPDGFKDSDGTIQVNATELRVVNGLRKLNLGFYHYETYWKISCQGQDTLTITIEGIERIDLAFKPDLDDFQKKLVSGETVKTINGQAILGEGNITTNETYIVPHTFTEIQNAAKRGIKLSVGIDLVDAVNSKKIILIPTGTTIADGQYIVAYYAQSSLPSSALSIRLKIQDPSSSVNNFYLITFRAVYAAPIEANVSIEKIPLLIESDLNKRLGTIYSRDSISVSRPNTELTVNSIDGASFTNDGKVTAMIPNTVYNFVNNGVNRTIVVYDDHRLVITSENNSTVALSPAVAYTSRDRIIPSALPSSLVTKPEFRKALGNKVDKVEGKGLSTEDFTTLLKQKLESLQNYDDTAISAAITKLRNDFDTLVESAGDKPIYIADFTMEDLYTAMNDRILLECDMQSLIVAIQTNKLILVRESIDEGWPGISVMNCYYDGELYFSIVDTEGNVITGGGSPEGIFGDSMLFKEETYITEFSVEDIKDTIAGKTINISVKIVEAVLAQKIIRIPIQENIGTMVVALSTTGYISSPDAGLILEFIYEGKRYLISIDDSMNDDYTLPLYRDCISVTTLVDDDQVTTIVNDAIATAITTTLNTPV